MKVFGYLNFKVHMRCKTFDQFRSYLSLLVMGKKNRRSLKSFSDAVVAAKKTGELDARGSIAYMLPFLKED